MDAAPWRPVPVAPALTGTEDVSGFAGLEELSGPEATALLAGWGMKSSGNSAAAAASKKQKRMRGDAAEPAARPPSSSSSLEARLAALEAENARLRAAVAGQPSPDKKIKKKAKRNKPAAPAAGGAKAAPAASTRRLGAAAAPEAPSTPPLPPPIDVSAWAPTGLGPTLTSALATSGFAAPTSIQALALPPALAGRRDVLGAAPTGSGKTLAYGLAVLQRLLDERAVREGVVEEATAAAAAGTASAPPPPSPLRALILCPTRELALQVAAALDPFARAAGVRVAPVVGGLAAPKQARLLAAGPAVVVATPGRLWAEVEGGHPHLGTPAALGGLACLVIDEADRMVADGSFPDLASILGRVEGAQAAKKKHNQGSGHGAGGEEDGASLTKAARAAAWAGAMQTFVFSATLTLPDALRRRVRGGKGGGAGRGGAGLDALVARVPLQPGRAPAVVDVSVERDGQGDAPEGDQDGGAPAPAADPAGAAAPAPAPARRLLAAGIAEATLRCPDLAARDAALTYLLSAHSGRALVFVNAVSCARRLAGLLRALGLPARPLHAGMQQRARLKALDRFVADPAGVLIATDVAARGLDVPGIASVIHYQIPASPDTYVHRCGRTGRGVDAVGAGAGVAVSLVVPGEAGRWEGLMRAMGRSGSGATPATSYPPDFPIEPRLLAAAAERVALAAVVDAATAKASRARADEAWRRRTAAEAGLALSDDDDEECLPSAVSDEEEEEEEEGLHPLPPPKAAHGKRRRRGGAGGASTQLTLPPTAAAARARLAALLAVPLAASASKGWARLAVPGAGGGGGGGGGTPATAAAILKKKKRAASKTAHLSAGDRRAAALVAAVAKRVGTGRKGGLPAKGAGRVHRAGRLVVAPAATGVRLGSVVGGGSAPLAALRAAGGG